MSSHKLWNKFWVVYSGPDAPRSSYERAQRRYNTWIWRLGIVVVVLSFLVAALHSVPVIGAILVCLVGVAILCLLIHLIVNGTRFFVLRYRGGYKLGPWADVPRKKR
jgi:hypothetical protein